MNGSDVFGFEMRLAVVALTLCGLVACDGGRYDETTGRYIPGAGSRPLSPLEMAPGPVVATAQLQNPCHRPDDLPRAALDTSGFGPAADQRVAYAQPSPAAAPGTPVVDAFSRTPPAPTLQSDGTPLRPAIARVSPESGGVEGGEELLITGSGFAFDGVQVMVGNAPARVTSRSSNAVTVLVPPAGRSGPTTVVVTNRDGSYATAGGAYIYM
jgi:IPT/TIG domain-containing protein